MNRGTVGVADIILIDDYRRRICNEDSRSTVGIQPIGGRASPQS